MDKNKPLNLLTADSKGRVPVRALIGTHLRHLGNMKLYVVTGFAFMGETDEWGFLHSEWNGYGDVGVTLVRPLSHLVGVRSNGMPRYEIEAQVEETFLK